VGKRLYTNNGAAFLAAPVGAGDTSLIVEPAQGQKFPNPDTDEGDWFIATLVKGTGEVEIIKVLARAADSFDEIERAQEGTVALDFAAGDRVELRPTAKSFSDIPQPNIDGTYDIDISGNAATASDAMLLDGRDSSVNADPNTVAVRDGEGDLAAHHFIQTAPNDDASAIEQIVFRTADGKYQSTTLARLKEALDGVGGGSALSGEIHGGSAGLLPAPVGNLLGPVEFLHGQDTPPAMLKCTIKCVEADLDWAVGDVIEYSRSWAEISVPGIVVCSLGADATKLVLGGFTQQGYWPHIPNKTLTSYYVPAPGKWEVFLYGIW
jgi:hypothetical protein